MKRENQNLLKLEPDATHLLLKGLVGHVGGLLAPQKRLREIGREIMHSKTGHYTVWLICFINIRRMFQFPPVNRISVLKLSHCDRNTRIEIEFLLESAGVPFGVLINR